MKKLLHSLSMRGAVNRRCYWCSSLLPALIFAALMLLGCMLAEGLCWHYGEALMPIGIVIFLLIHIFSLPAAMLHPLAGAAWVLIPPAYRMIGQAEFIRTGELPGLTSGLLALDVILGILLLLGLLFCSLRLTALSVRRQRDAGNRFRLLPGLLFVVGALTPRFYAEHDLFDIIRYHAYDDVVLVALLVWSACWYVVQLVRLSLPTREQAPTAAKLP